MPTTNTSEAPTTQQETTTTPETQPVETIDWKAEAGKWKALSRKNEDRARENAEKAHRLDQIEEQSKSEIQKALEAKAAAEERATKAEATALRARVAAAKGVDADLLTGSTEEEVAACADRLLSWRDSTTTTKPVPPSTSSSDAGARGDDVQGPSQLSREDLKGMTPEEINKARREGRLNKILGVS